MQSETGDEIVSRPKDKEEPPVAETESATGGFCVPGSCAGEEE